MSEPLETKPEPQTLRCCANCQFWDRDWVPSMSKAQSTWGYCGIGLGENQHMTNRMTTDMLCCSGWTLKVEPPKP